MSRKPCSCTTWSDTTYAKSPRPPRRRLQRRSRVWFEVEKSFCEGRSFVSEKGKADERRSQGPRVARSDARHFCRSRRATIQGRSLQSPCGDGGRAVRSKALGAFAPGGLGARGWTR